MAGDATAADLRGRILDGELLLGMFLDLGSAVSAEIVAHAGFDWIVLDAEHGALGAAPLFGQLQAVAGGSAAPFVRVPSPRSELLGWALDAGAAGIVVPRSDSVRDVLAALSASRYGATRGAAPGVRAARFGRDRSYLPNADERRVLLIQIETVPALAAVEQIAAIDGVDVLFLGPTDLARSLGLAGVAADHPQILEAAERIAAAAQAAGKAAGVYVDDPDHAADYRRLGYSVIGSGFEAGLVRDAAGARLARLAERARGA
ncbi:MAG: 2-dehydro-3-deoxyglucarate aldolase [Solirubrobacteraceae bacterium]|nr:2-dehydro-3-deoxyglucarate aldolase [Solirubrobacteraceae bacterium]